MNQQANKKRLMICSTIYWASEGKGLAKNLARTREVKPSLLGVGAVSEG